MGMLIGRLEQRRDEAIGWTKIVGDVEEGGDVLVYSYKSIYILGSWARFAAPA